MNIILKQYIINGCVMNCSISLYATSAKYQHCGFQEHLNRLELSAEDGNVFLN